MNDPRWEKPAPLGYAASADAAHFVAAPLLAAGALALLGVVAADHDKFRLPEAAMLVLTLALIALVASIQFGFQARQWLYSAADVTAWWGEQDLPEREEKLRRDQQADFERWRRHNHRAVTTYNGGVTLLATGVAMCLAPPVNASAAGSVTRWLACALAGLAALAELTYLLTQTSWMRK